MIFSLALRNLRRHYRNSLLLILLFSVITALFYTGNAVMAESNRGMKKSFIDNFTSHLVIKAPTEMEVGLFGATTPSIGEFYALPVLKERDALEQLAKNQPDIEAVTPLIYGACALDAAGIRYNIPVFGVEGEGYFDFFPGIHIVEGSKLQDGMPGVMITRSRFERIQRDSGRELETGEPLLLSMYGNGGFKIRQVPLAGVFTYENSNPQLDEMVITDMQTIRSLNSLSLAKEEDQTILEKDMDLLGGELDDLFQEEDLFEEASEGESAVHPGVIEDLVDTVDMTVFQTGGSCHFLLLKLRNARIIPKVESRLSRIIEHNGFEAEIIGWRQAAGLSAQLIFLLRILYNTGFLLVALAGCIALVNILLISVFDRTPEIGTLRAVGARKSYVRKLILTENLVLAGIGAVTGILAGQLVLFGVNALSLPIRNGMLQNLLGQRILYVGIAPLWWGISLITTLILGWIASVYPVSRALRIQPVTAQSRG